MTRPQCKGKSRRSGERCKQLTEGDSDYCRFHGARIPRGPRSHFYKHGGYAKYVPDRMRADVARLAADEKLLDLNQEVALLKARVTDVLKQVDTGESGKAWKALKAAMKDHDRAMRAGDFDTQAEALIEMRKLIGFGTRDWEAWEDLRAVVRDVTRVAESQRKYLLEQHHMITVDAAFVLLDVLVDVVRRTVPDAEVRDIISAEFERIMHSQGREQAALASHDYAA